MLENSDKIRAIGQDYNTLQLYLSRFDNKVRDPLLPSKSNGSITKRMSRLSRISMATVTEDDSRPLYDDPANTGRSKRSPPQLWTLIDEQEKEGTSKEA